MIDMRKTKSSAKKYFTLGLVTFSAAFSLQFEPVKDFIRDMSSGILRSAADTIKPEEKQDLTPTIILKDSTFQEMKEFATAKITLNTVNRCSATKEDPNIVDKFLAPILDTTVRIYDVSAQTKVILSIDLKKCYLVNGPISLNKDNKPINDVTPTLMIPPINVLSIESVSTGIEGVEWSISNNITKHDEQNALLINKAVVEKMFYEGTDNIVVKLPDDQKKLFDIKENTEKARISLESILKEKFGIDIKVDIDWNLKSPAQYSVNIPKDFKFKVTDTIKKEDSTS